ncbi:MAG: tagaturonate reductase [Pedobacter sp.]|nr:tagaturonate reductase [Pedobacter sp.]
MALNRENLSQVKNHNFSIPHFEIFEFPERIIQFGTGVLLRGLPDYFVHKANQKGIFNGRILVVKSTTSGDTDDFSKQNCLYTICVKGIENGVVVEENTINASINRVLSAQQDWAEILKASHQLEMQIVISNTTEVGIVDSDDRILDAPPKTYPGKLLAFLYERFKAFGGTASSGMVILPTELISNNADVLKNILIKLSNQNNLNADFLNWLSNHNDFCNTLVDRIVPGKLSDADQIRLENQLGYKDELAIMAEPFRLWAIESSEARVSTILSFSTADEGVFIVPSIEKFKELKLRLLNGTHTMVCALAILAGFDTVKKAMANRKFNNHVLKLMETEILPAVESAEISREEAMAFAKSVADRFGNPSLEHHWQAITLNYTSKIKMRNLPLIERYYTKENKVPKRSALGLAAYIVLMNSKKDDQNYLAEVDGRKFKLQDESAEKLYKHWQNRQNFVKSILSDESLWGTDLTHYPGFYEAVNQRVNQLRNKGAKAILNELNTEENGK